MIDKFCIGREREWGQLHAIQVLGGSVALTNLCADSCFRTQFRPEVLHTIHRGDICYASVSHILRVCHPKPHSGRSSLLSTIILPITPMRIGQNSFVCPDTYNTGSSRVINSLDLQFWGPISYLYFSSKWVARVIGQYFMIFDWITYGTKEWTTKWVS